MSVGMTRIANASLCTVRGAALTAQCGAAALMATVFLLLIVALLGVIGLRLSATDVTDTALQNDSVEALFLAESGVERASQRLAAGIPCTTLAEPGTFFTLGRGDFEIQTASVDGTTGWCNVRILGRFLLAGSPSAQRQIEVALQQAGGVAAWAVGSGGAIYGWSGSSWSAAASLTPNQLNAVHCVSSTECWAVGNGGVIRRWYNGSWSVSPNANGQTLNGVSCIIGNPSACYAVGNDVVRRWNGSSWGTSSFPGGKLTAVSCSSSTCYATRDEDEIWRLNTATNTWVRDVTIIGKWNAISCLASGECWVAGNSNSNNYQFARLQSGTWSPIPYNNTPAKNLYGIHCTASDMCWSVGQPHGSSDKIVRRTAGAFAAIEPVGGENLRAVGCSSATDCLAVGDNGDVQRWNGSGWSQATAGMPSVNLYGVAMTGVAGGGGGGSVQLVRWQERVQ